jgi:hypothetical protein
VPTCPGRLDPPGLDDRAELGWAPNAAIAHEPGGHPQTVCKHLLRLTPRDSTLSQIVPARKPDLVESECGAILGMVATDPPGRLVRQPHGALEADDERGQRAGPLNVPPAPASSRDGHHIKPQLDHGRGPEKVRIYGALRCVVGTRSPSPLPGATPPATCSS